MRPPFLLFLIIAVATAVYPFIVYTSLNQLGPTTLALVLLALLLARVIVRKEYHQPEQYLQLTLVGSLCLLAAWLNSERLLRYYPVLMSLGFALLFAFSLLTKKTLTERMASMFIDDADIESHHRIYMRRLSIAWAVLLLINTFVAAYTACCLSLKQWTFYNGAIAYVVFGLFILAELVYRHFYKKRYYNNKQANPSLDDST